MNFHNIDFLFPLINSLTKLALPKLIETAS
ncbi:hypothetical protein AGR7C_Cc260150 [Agrobacterium deltaense Zutra 3/1]|uniref:Uncharacterized protein n=1 Tax=Agrobacterium deltaense Zutra 3/1 TaxID=1183427 RepID=A0A1S7Q7U1_9HYPH|nr:hypothetical protein AGR7C_Cc260150 [Agrobacterium deltaense Zutra 3/1]